MTWSKELAKLGFLFFLLALITGSTTCNRENPPAKPPTKPIEIGVIFPLSGNLGYVGQMLADGMKLAAADINATGGIKGAPLKLLFDDSQGKPDVAVTVAQKMLSVDKVPVIFTALSSVTLGVQPVVENNNAVLIGLCMHPEFFKGHPNTFRLYEGAEQEGEALGKHLAGLVGSQPAPVLGIIYADVPNIVEEIEKYIKPPMALAGMEFKVSEPYLLSDKEFRDKVLKVRQAGVTHLVILGYGFEYPNIFRELKAQQLLPGIKIIGGWGFLYPQVPKEDLEGVIVIGPEYVFTDSPIVKDFQTRFQQKFNYAPNFDAALAYNALIMLTEGLRKSSNISSPDIVMAINDLKSFNGILGNVTIDSDGGLMMSIGIGKYHDNFLVKQE